MYNAEENMPELSMALQKLAKKYTLNDSSTITIETAQKLIGALLYSINYYLDSFDKDDEAIVIAQKKDDAYELYEKGQQLIKKDFVTTYGVYKQLKNEEADFNNLSYHETINGLAEFFACYNMPYEPHENPGSIDYQLFIPVESLNGLRFASEYIKRFKIENDFLRRLNINEINSLLRGYNKDSDTLLLNIYELVLLNIIGLEILTRDYNTLNISENEKNIIYNEFSRLSLFDIEERLINIAENIQLNLKITSEDDIDYLKQSIVILSRSIKNASRAEYEKLFITCDYSKCSFSDDYIDGEQMSDKKLREVIEEAKSCSSIEDKLDIIKQEVHSLADLVEILDSCIWDDEYNHVFKLLSDREIDYLMQEINELIILGTDLDDLKEWQKRLIIYINNL